MDLMLEKEQSRLDVKISIQSPRGPSMSGINYIRDIYSSVNNYCCPKIE